MMTKRPVIRWPGKKPLCAPIPAARDPFVNTPLLKLTPDRNGLDRFWISSWNAAFGCLGVCINELGEHRVYPSGSFHYAGFYSAVQTDDDTLWLCAKLSCMVRLNLKTGLFKEFATGAPPVMPFAGMAYDARTGKVVCRHSRHPKNRRPFLRHPRLQDGQGVRHRHPGPLHALQLPERRRDLHHRAPMPRPDVPALGSARRVRHAARHREDPGSAHGGRARVPHDPRRRRAALYARTGMV